MYSQDFPDQMFPKKNAASTRSPPPRNGLSEASETGKAVYAKNYGCAANLFDFEVMLGLLIGAGHHMVNRPDSADIILVNTCGVKKPTEDRVIQKLRRLNRLCKPLIVAGCLPKINPEAISKAAPDLSAMLDPQSVDKILLAVEAAVKGEKNRVFFSQMPPVKLGLPKTRLNRTIEIVPISEGCNGACTFCCVRLARGALFSYPEEAIVRRVAQAVEGGAKEIWITSQDNGAYGLDARTNLAELLKECCRVKGKFLIRVGMMNPDYLSRILPDLIDAYRNEKVFKFLHLPIQSGDDETLRRMNRRYTVEEFKEIVNTFRQAVPDLSLATDVICGFPSETREAFERTLSFVEEVKPDTVNISKFFPRPNTPAEKMRQHDAGGVKARSTELTRIVRRITFEQNERWLGWKGEILIDEKGRGASWIGRNFAYKPIVIKGNEDLLGKFVQAKVVKAFSTYLVAELACEPTR